MESTVVSVAEGSTAVMGKLACILSQEYRLLTGVGAEIQYIKDELGSMNAFLQDLLMSSDHTRQVKDWMKQVREIAYDVEDCIDEFRHGIDDSDDYNDGPLCFLDSIICVCFRDLVMPFNSSARHRIAMDVKELKNRIQQVSDRRQRYGVAVIPRTSTSRATSTQIGGYSRLSSFFLQEDYLIDIKKRRDTIVEWLMEENQPDHGVISIFGYGGIGKSTLATMAYTSPRVTSGYFQHRAMVTVSQKVNIESVFRDILRQVNTDKDLTQEVESWDMFQLAEELQTYLKQTRYVIVLDDIWTVSAWNNIKGALPDDRTGSRIIVTTRFETVARTCCSHDYDHVYKMEPLSNEESEGLFFKRALNSLTNYPLELENIVKEILNKCNGSPLAVISIASLLSTRPKTEEQLKEVLNSLNSELETDSLPDGINQILTFSYNDLPNHLKTCFLYLSIYPEDYKIRRKSLLRRWIAEDFVREKRGLCVEDVAESYFNELINRGVLHPVLIGGNNKIKMCRVHDMMLEIIISKSIEENFITLIGEQYTTIPHEKVRRLSVFDTNLKHVASTMDLSHVRTITLFGEIKELHSSNKSKLLRVLDLEGCKGLKEHHVKNICKLFQLIFLSFRNTDLKALPEQIRQLKYLQTFDIRGTNVEMLPRGIVELQCLAHFLAGSKRRKYNGEFRYLISKVKMPCRIQDLRAIQTLGVIELSKDITTFNNIEQLTRLKKLGISINKDINRNEEIKASLKSMLELLSVLRSLTISAINFSISLEFIRDLVSFPLLLESLELRGYLGSLPSWIKSLNNLTQLTLCYSRLSTNDLGFLGKLPSLLNLKLQPKSFNFDDKYLKKEEFDIQIGFGKLKVFVIDDKKFPRIKFNKGVMPMLEKVELYIDTLCGIYGIENLLKLKELHLECPIGDQFNNTVKKVNDAIRNITEEFQPKFTVVRYNMQSMSSSRAICH